MKKSLLIRSVIFLLFLACLFPSLISCKQDSDTEELLSSYSSRIASLQNEISLLKELQLSSELESDSEIAKLKLEIEALKKSIDEAESAGGESATEKAFEYIVENGTATITRYKGSQTTVIVPASIDGYTVKSIGDDAFKGSSIVSVSLPDTLASIGWFAFSDCSSLKSAIIPKSVTEIGYEAFSNCKRLTIYTDADSYAAKYAKSYGISVSTE